MKKVIEFIELTSHYPLMHGIETKKKKELDDIEVILEELYKFVGWNPGKGDENTLYALRSAYRDYEIFLRMKQFPLKDTYVDKVFAELEKSLELAYDKFSEVMKKHQKLNSYFKENFKMKRSEMKAEISKEKYDYNKGKQNENQ